MKKSVISNSIVFLLTLFLLKLSWLTIFIPLSLLVIMIGSFIGDKRSSAYSIQSDKWSFGFMLLSGAKNIKSDYGNNFWIVIRKDANDYYYAYLVEDKLFHCKIKDKIDFSGNIEHIKSTVKRKLDSYYGDIQHTKNYNKMINNAFNEWDGCLTKEDSRDKKINEIC